MHADKPAFCDENRVFTFGELQFGTEYDPKDVK